MENYSEAMSYLNKITIEEELAEAETLKKVCFKNYLKELYQKVNEGSSEQNITSEMEVDEDEDATESSEQNADEIESLPGSGDMRINRWV